MKRGTGSQCRDPTATTPELRLRVCCPVPGPYEGCTKHARVGGQEQIEIVRFGNEEGGECVNRLVSSILGMSAVAAVNLGSVPQFFIP